MANLPVLRYIPSPNYSSRTSPIHLVVVHDTEGSYESAISWFHNPNSAVSAHVVLREDGLQATQMVDYGSKAWHCVMYNSESIGLEMAGRASRGYGRGQLEHAARIVAFLLHKYHLPPNHVKPSSPGTTKGWTMHQDLGAKGGGHHDPGFSRVQAWRFGRMVKKEYKRGNFRKVWGRE